MSQWVAWDDAECFVSVADHPTPMAAVRGLMELTGERSVSSYLHEFGFPKRARLPMCSGDEGEHIDDGSGECPLCVLTDVWRSEGYRIKRSGTLGA